MQNNCFEAVGWVNKMSPFLSIILSGSMIWSIQQCYCNKPMMTYPGTWKSVLILSQSRYQLNVVPGANRCFSLRRETPLKGSGLLSGQWILLVSRLVVLFWLVCVILSNNSHVTMFRIEAIFHVTIWLRNRKVWKYQGIGHGACSCDLFLLDLSNRNSSSSRPLEEQMLYPSFYHSSNLSNSPHVFYSKRGERMAYLDPPLWFQNNRNMPSSQSQWFLFDG